MLVNTSLFAGLIDAIKNIFKLLGGLGNLLSGILMSVVSLIYFIIYYVFMGIAFIMNFAEVLFRKFAGLDTMMTNDGKSADIITIFISSDEVWGLFVSVIVLSIVLLLLFTFIAIIKSEFSLDVKGSAKGPIIARALKSFAMFIIVPAVSVAGIYATNAITETINGMFAGGSSTMMSNQVFYVAAYNSNRARNDSDFARYISGQKVGDYSLGSNTKNRDGGTFSDPNSVAYEIDMAFRADRKINGNDWVNLSFTDKVDSGLLLETMLGLQPYNPSHFSPWNPGMVNYYYKITNFDFVLGIGTAVYMAYVLLSMCVVLIKRVFEITILLLLAPPLIAMAPIDGGNASKTWQKEFIKRVIAIIGPVFAINMYFVLVPVFMSISLFSGGLSISGVTAAPAVSSQLGVAVGAVAGSLATAYIMYDAFFQLLTLCVGMQVVKMSSALISNLLGIEDLVKSGGEATKKAVGTAVQIAGMASGVGMAAGGLFKSVGSAISTKHKGGTFKEGWAKTKESRQKGMELLKDKTIGSKMVQESAFGELINPDTYKNMGLTNKEIKKKDAAKKKQEEIEADEEARKNIDEGKAKKAMKKQVNDSYAGTIGAGGTLTVAKQNANQEFVASKRALNQAKAHTQSFIDPETGTISNMAGYNAALAAERAAQTRFDTAKAANRTANNNYDQEVARRDAELHAIETGKVATIARDDKGNVVGGTLEAPKSAGQVLADDTMSPAAKFGEFLDRLLKFIGGKEVPKPSDRRLVGDDEHPGMLNTKLANSAVVAQAGNRAEDHYVALAKKAEELGITRDAENIPQAMADVAGTGVDDVKAALDRNGLADAVEQGIKEARDAIANALKDAMASSKLGVEGVKEIVEQVKKIELRAKQAQDGDDANGIVDALNALADDIKKKSGS